MYLLKPNPINITNPIVHKYLLCPGVALVTPFNENGKVDYNGLQV